MFWQGILLAAIIRVMGRGLQHDILGVLGKQRGWSRPKDILSALNREPTATNRVGMSKALKRLCEQTDLYENARGLQRRQIVSVQSATAALMGVRGDFESARLAAWCNC
jgi:hypothetical protein